MVDQDKLDSDKLRALAEVPPELPLDYIASALLSDLATGWYIDEQTPIGQFAMRIRQNTPVVAREDAAIPTEILFGADDSGVILHDSLYDAMRDCECFNCEAARENRRQLEKSEVEAFVSWLVTPDRG